MTKIIEGTSRSPSLRGIVETRLEGLARRHRVKPISVRVGFVDENGPKGGVDIRCALSLDLPRRPTLHVNEFGINRRAAFDAAFDALERRMAREVEQGRERRRRPKKYYVAKRLLSPKREPPAGN